MLLFLIGCFQIDGTDWSKWQEEHDDSQNGTEPYFIQDAEISPNEGITTGITLTCSASAADGVGGSLSPTYAWKRGNEDVSTGETYILTPEDTDVGDTITCVASIPVGEGEETTQDAVTIENTAPEFTEEAEITPDSEVKIGAEVAYTWLVDEQEIGTGQEDYTVSIEDVEIGDQITCALSVTDGDGETTVSSADISVENTDPFVNNVNINSDDGPYNDSAMTCVADVFDPDQEGPVASFSWKKNGSPIGVTEQSINLEEYGFLPTQMLTCTVSAIDDGGGSHQDEVSITIQNRPPSVNVNIDNQNPEADAFINCNASAADPDGESLSLDYLWELDGNNVGNGSSLDLSNQSNVFVGAVIRCTVSTSDDYGGSDSQFATGTVQNTLPIFTSQAEIAESTANIVSELNCSAAGIDINDGALSPDYEWYNAGTLMGSGSSIQLNSGMVSLGDMVECRARLTDNNADFVESSDTILIENSPPVFIQAVEISPNPTVYTGDELTCSAVANDPEDGAVSPVFTWKVNGNTVFTGTTYTVDVNGTNVGDTISCTGVAEDSVGETIEDTASVIVGNTLPSLVGTTLSLQSGNGNYNDSIYFCNSSGSDPDGTSVTVSYEWYSDWGGSNPTVLSNLAMYTASSNSLMPGDILTCVITGIDGDNGLTTDEIDVAIANRAPPQPDITVTPLVGSIFALPTSSLTCTASGSIDSDGETVSYIYSWENSSGATISSDILDSSNTLEGDFWTCSVIAVDVMDSSLEASTEVKITKSCSFGFCDTVEDLGATSSSERLELALIPAGSDPTGSYSLSNNFYMMTTEVTQAMFNEVTGHTSHEGESLIDSSGNSYGIGNDHPAFYVDWHMATYFANAVTQIHNSMNNDNLSDCYSCSIDGSTGAPTCASLGGDPYSCDGYRLPTEAEWEYAARAGVPYDFWTPAGGGDALDPDCSSEVEIGDDTGNSFIIHYGWWCGNSDQVNGGTFGAKEVAQKLPNGFGLYDMHGNVYELTSDSSTTASACPNYLTGTDPYCDDSGATNNYIIRGGHWFNLPALIATSSRSYTNTTIRNYTGGFRLVRNQ